MTLEEFVRAMGEAFEIPLTGRYSADWVEVTLFLERACDRDIEELWQKFGPEPDIDGVAEFVVQEQTAINEAGIAEFERGLKFRQEGSSYE